MLLGGFLAFANAFGWFLDGLGVVSLMRPSTARPSGVLVGWGRGKDVGPNKEISFFFFFFFLSFGGSFVCFLLLNFYDCIKQMVLICTLKKITARKQPLLGL